MILSYQEQLMTLLKTVEATGTGTEHDMGQMYSKFTVQIVFTNAGGSVTALTVDLEGSTDGVKWFTLASHILSADELTAKAAMFHVINKSVRYLRGNIITLTETGTTAVTVKAIAERR